MTEAMERRASPPVRDQILLALGKRSPPDPPVPAAEVSFSRNLPGADYRKPSNRGSRPHQPETGILETADLNLNLNHRPEPVARPVPRLKPRDVRQATVSSSSSVIPFGRCDLLASRSLWSRRFVKSLRRTNNWFDRQTSFEAQLDLAGRREAVHKLDYLVKK
jgi:hypothetical protein